MSASNISQDKPNSGITNVQLGADRGVLSAVGDPLGKGLEKGLRPVGSVVGGLTQGVTGQSTDLVRGAGEALGITRSSAEEGKGTKGEDQARIGGGKQTAENPLGL